MGKLEDLERLQKLRESGALTEEEFEKEKQNLLNNSNTNLNNEKETKKIETINKNSTAEKKTLNKKTKNILIGTFIAFVIIIIGCLVVIPLVKSKIAESKKVTIPNIEGKTYAEAQKELSALELNMKTKYYWYSNDPNAIIVSQEPSEGKIANKGDSITVKSMTQEEIDEDIKKQEEQKKKQEEARKNGYRKSPATSATIVSCAKTLIDNTLKSSSTAVWGDSELIEQDNYGRCLVYVSLEAQNGFGAYSKLFYFVVLQYVEYDGHFTYNPYFYSHKLTTYSASSPYDYYVSAYKNGTVYPVIQTFLDNNGWNTRPDDVKVPEEDTNKDIKGDEVKLNNSYTEIKNGEETEIIFISDTEFEYSISKYWKDGNSGKVFYPQGKGTVGKGSGKYEKNGDKIILKSDGLNITIALSNTDNTFTSM